MLAMLLTQYAICPLKCQGNCILFKLSRFLSENLSLFYIVLNNILRKLCHLHHMMYMYVHCKVDCVSREKLHDVVNKGARYVFNKRRYDRIDF